MKKFNLIVFGLIGIFISLNTYSQLPFADGFESGNLNNWMASGDTLVIDANPYEGLACFQGTNGYQIQKTFSPISENQFTVEFAMKAAQLDREAVDFLVYDESNNTIARIYFANTGSIVSKNGVQDVNIMGYQINTWYLIRLEINQSTFKYDIYIDDVLVGNQFDFISSAVGPVVRFYFGTGEPSGSIGYIDDFSISSESAGTERDALMALYNATDGQNWTDNTNWGSELPLGDWFGVTTDVDGFVTGINMTNNNLNGLLPSDIGNLTYLSSLRLDGHQLSGIIPVELYSMANLIYVNLSNNLFSGELSSLIGNMPVIQSLILYNNQFTGSIPGEIGNCTSLTNLDIGDQALTGEIPVELGSLTNLTFLAIRSTGLTGAIPNELCNLENLQYLYLDQNELSGEIPAGFGLGLLLELKQFWIDHNNFTGSLPADIVASLPNLNSFVFNSNKFDEVPADFQFFGGATVTAENNNFTFEDLENLPQSASYFPQNTINIYDTAYLDPGVEGTIQLSFDNDVVGSNYDWYREGVYMSTTQGNSILATESNAGTFVYSLQITNQAFPNFTLEVDSVIVIVGGGTSGGNIMEFFFDEYNNDDYLAVVDQSWTTWSGQPGGSEDGLITNVASSSAPNSVNIENTTDLVLPIGSYTSGRYQIDLDIYVPSGNVGYFNVEHTSIPGESYAMECFFNVDGAGQIRTNNQWFDFSYNNDSWNTIFVKVDLDNDWAQLMVNFQLVHEWQWSTTMDGSVGPIELGLLDVYANPNNGTPQMYLDNVIFSELDPVNCNNIGLTGTFNDWGNIGIDLAMTQNPDHPYQWTANLDLTEFSEILFREDNNWDFTWGGESFPIGLGFQGGPNIQVPAASYLVHFNCESGNYNFESESERNALMALYNATDGDNWTNNTNWNTSAPLDDWFGVTTDQQTGSVTELNLEDNNLVGTIPSEIGDLSNLITINFYINSLSGSIPLEFYNLSNLENVNFSENDLSGTIPSQISQLSSLQHISLFNNDIGGTIPDEITQISTLTNIDFGGNQFTGSIPNNIGSMTSLFLFSFWGNQLSGEIPAGLWELSNLNWLNLEGNQFTGTFPSSIGNMTQLRSLNINGGGSLSGPLPSDIGNLTNLEELKMWGHQLTGPLPSSFWQLSNLEILDLGGNQFDGNIPIEFANLSNLQELYLWGNQFDGEIPSVLGDLSYLEILIIYGNNLNGTLPESLLNLTTLYDLQLNNNHFDMVSDLFAEMSIETMNIANNDLTFEDIQNLPPGAVFNPQNTIPINDTANVIIGEDYTYSLDFDLSVANSTYQWFRDGVFFEERNNGELTFYEEPNGQTHYYYVQITNTNYPNFTLTTDSLVVETENCQLSFEFTPVDVACFGESTGSIDMIASNGEAPYEYSIDEGSSYQTSGLFENLNADIYYISAKDALGCETDLTEVFILEPEEALSFITTTTNVLCGGDATGEISFSAFGGTDPYEYSINNGATWQTSPDFTGLSAGDYDVAVRDANLCESFNFVTILEPLDALSFTATPTDVLCNGDENGEISFSASGGTAPYEYSIDNGDIWETFPDFIGLLAGDYYVAVRDANLCQTGDLVTIGEPVDGLSFTATPADVLCSGDATGEISFAASGGTPTYEYSIDNGETWQTSPDFTGLAAGYYDAAVRDANLCQTGDLVTIGEPIDALSFTATPTDVLCSGDATGEISFAASGGSAPYEYSIDNGETWQTSSDFTGLAAGYYDAAVRDANLCQTGDLVTIGEPVDGLSFTATPTDVLCSGDATGEISFAASGGTPTYEYSIDNGETWQTSPDFTGLAAGYYDAAVRDANLCQTGDLVTIGEPVDGLSFTATPTDVLCSGDATGEISFAASGGTPTYEYSIDNGETWQTSPDFTGLAAGYYDAAVRDANLCQTGDLVTIGEPVDGLSFTATPTDVLCSGDATGEISFAASGGTPTYEYSIDNGETWQTSPDFTGLAAGYYDAAVRDANLCQTGDLVTIGEPVDGLSFTATPADVLCNGDANGEISFSASGGTAPYEYSIDNGNTWQASPDFIGLSAGDYDVAVRDANLCESFDFVTISEPLDALSFTATPTDVLCNGDANGEISFAASGGTPTYEYSIDNGNTWQASPDFTGLSAGDYDVAVRDANLCESFDFVTISEPLDALSFTATPTDVLCNGDANGEISFAASGGTPTYEYSIDNGNTWQASPDFTGLSAGDYDVAVRDANLCESFDFVTISEPLDALSFTATPTDVLCNGDANGEISFAASGGTPTYEYSIDNGNTWQASPDFTGLSAGDYDVAVRDANLCESFDFVTISEPLDALSFTATPTDVLCNGDANGEISFAASGGTPTYEYSIDNGNTWQASPDFTGLTAGDYDVAVRDANLCESFDFVTISEPVDALTYFANITDVTCFGGGDGEIEIIGSGGFPTYEYSIDNGTNWQTTSIFTGLVAGEYDVLIRDANLCEAGGLETLTEPSALPTVNFIGLDTDYCENGVAVTITGNQAPEGEFFGTGITDNGNGTAEFDPVVAGVGGPYDITYSYTDLDGCTNSETQQTSVNAIVVISFTGLDTDYCIDAAATTLTGSEAPEGIFSGPGITDNGNGTAVFDPATAGAGGPYDIIYEYTNGGGCISQSVNQTTISDLPIVEFSGLDAAYCLGDASITLTGNQAPNGTFSGTGITDNEDGTAIFDPNTAGIGGPYDITYTYADGLGCENSDIQQTSVYDLPTVSFSGLNPDYCEGGSEILITGSQAPNGSFSGPGVFDQGNGTAYFYPAVAGVGGPFDVIYSYTNANGCTGESIQQTTVNPLPDVSFTGLDESYCLTDDAITLTGNQADGTFSGPGITDNGDGTALFTPADAGSGGPFDIVFSYITPEGCSDEYILETEVYPSEEINFTGLDASYCSDVEPVTLIGSIAPDGVYTGTGITDNGDGTATFDPQSAGIGGPYSILYEFTNTFGCYQNDEQFTDVYEKPQVSFTGLDTAYCVDAGSVIVTANYSGGIFSGPGITDNGDGTATFNPANAGTGEDMEINYLYETPEGCSDDTTMRVDVIGYISLSFTELDDEICASDQPITLLGNIAPEGSFFGPGIADNGDGTATFDPYLAGAGGPYTIIYEYLSSGLCLNTTEQSVTVLPVVELSFSGLGDFYCNENSDHVLTGSLAPDGFFLGPGIDNNGNGTASFNPYEAGVGGPYRIRYYVNNAGGCSDVGIGQTVVLDDPVADFSFDLGGCNQDAVFMDMSTSPNGNITSWNWNFDDPDSEGNNLSDVQNPLHQFVSNKSLFNIELAIEDVAGCSASAIQLVEPFSSTTITGNVLSSEGETITSGYVLIYLLSDGVLSTKVDSVQISNDGSFIFENLATCVDYILQAHSNEEVYTNLIPRWHYEAFYWFDALPVSVAWDDILVEDIDISLFEYTPPPPGSSTIEGGVFYFDSKGEPVKNVDVVLEYEAPDEKGDEIVGHDPTNDLGEWKFDKLGEGTFKIKVDIPGLTMDSVYQVVINEPNTLISGLNYYLDPENGIYTEQTGLEEYEEMEFASISVFPNPNSGLFHIEIVRTARSSRLDIESVELYDLDGRMVKDLGIRFVGDHYFGSVNLNDVEPGMYFLKVNNQNSTGTVKIVIQR